MNEKLLCDLIEFKTIAHNYSDFFECFEYIKNYFQDTKLLIDEYVFNGNKSFVIKNCNTKEFDIIFAGHIDVVDGHEEQFIPFIKGNKLYGRGAFDMKGHVSVMMEIMRNLTEINTPYKVALFITSDEECGGFNGVSKLINEIGYNAKIAIVPDAGNDFNLIIEEKGVLQLKLSYQGKSAHSSKLWEGDNALISLIDVYQKLIENYPLPKSSDEYITSINLASLKGGETFNKVCEEAYMLLDIRHVASDNKEDFINYIDLLNPKIKVEVLAEGEEFIYLENELSKKIY